MKMPNKISSWAVLFLFLALTSLSCREQEYRLQTKTPAVQKVLNHRKARTPEIQAIKAKGLIGENNRGFLTILKPAEIQAKEKSLVEAENRGRKFIYNTVVAQNHLKPEDLIRVEHEFAKTRIERAKKEDLIQNASGQWTRK